MKLYLPALFISFFCMVTHLKAQLNEPTSAMGYTWGMSYQECAKQVKKSKIKYWGEKDAEIIYKEPEGHTVKLEFEQGLFRVTRSKSFPQEEYTQSMEYFNKILEHLVETHGNYRKPKAQEKEVLVFEWKFKITTLTLIYHIPTNTITLEYAKV